MHRDALLRTWPSVTRSLSDAGRMKDVVSEPLRLSERRNVCSRTNRRHGFRNGDAGHHPFYKCHGDGLCAYVAAGAKRRRPVIRRRAGRRVMRTVTRSIRVHRAVLLLLTRTLRNRIRHEKLYRPSAKQQRSNEERSYSLAQTRHVMRKTHKRGSLKRTFLS